MLPEQDLHPDLKTALLKHRKLGLYSYAPPQTREMLELTHNNAVLRTLRSPDPIRLRSESALIKYFSSSATLDQTAKVIGVGRETVRKGLFSALATRHSFLDLKNQELYPLEEINNLHHKYLPPEHHLLITDNMGSKIMLELLNGANFNQISSLLNLDPEDLAKRLRLLRSLNIEVPAIPHSAIENSWVLKNLHDETKTDRDIQFYLNRVTHGIYDLDRLSGNRVLSPITPVAQEMGYHVFGRNAKEFIKVVGVKVPLSREFETGVQNGIPKRYRFAITWHRNRVEEAIKEAESLDQYLKPLVDQISGVPLSDKELPTSYQIMEGKGILRVGTVLLEELNIRPESADYRKVREAIYNNGYSGNTFFYKRMFMVTENSRHSLKEYAQKVLGIVPEITAE